LLSSTRFPLGWVQLVLHVQRPDQQTLDAPFLRMVDRVGAIAATCYVSKSKDAGRASYDRDAYILGVLPYPGPACT
jgi:hypothetical protein